MDYVQLLNEVKWLNDRDAQKLARSYGIDLSIEEIRALRPLLDEISILWLFSGVPDSFIHRVKKAVGERKGNELLQHYLKYKEQ